MQAVKKAKPALQEDKPIPQKVWINFITNQNESVGRADVPLEAGPRRISSTGTLSPRTSCWTARDISVLLT